MKVLFVNPPNTTSFHVDKPGKYVEENIGDKYFIIPRTPFQITANLFENKDIEKDIILLDFEWYKDPNLSKENLVDLVIDRNPDIVLTTLISTSNADSIDWLTTKIKEKSPNTKIVIGGQGVETLEERTFTYVPNIDIAILTGSKNVLPSVLERIIQGQSFDNISGVMYRSNGNIIKNSSEKNNEPIYSPEIMYEPFKKLLGEVINTVKKREALPIGLLETYKGCPFTCDFCAAKKPVKKRTLDSTLEELDYLYKMGISKYYFIDLTFGLNKSDTKILLSKLSDFKIKHNDFGLRCITRADIIDDGLAEQLCDAGCYEIGIGIETNDDNVLKEMSKKSSKGVNWKAINILGKYDVKFKLFLIEGYKGSTSQTSFDTFRLLNQIRDKGYAHFIQPALSRDIMPHQQGFTSREQSGIMRRGTTSQLDLRHDGRNFGWDDDRSLRAMCYYMLAYPSTEISQERSEIGLQQRAVLDLPFLTSRDLFSQSLNMAGNSLQRDVVHYLDGVYTPNEIKERIVKLYPNLEHDYIDLEVDNIINTLRNNGVVDSFGNSNSLARPYYRREDIKENNNKFIKTSKDILQLWDGKDQRYLYFPGVGEVKKISISFYQNIPNDAFEFLFFAKASYDSNEIANRMFKLFKGVNGYESLKEAKITTNKIKETYQHAGILQ